MDQRDYLEKIGKYLSGDMDRAEQEELERWVEADPVHRSDFEEAKKLWELTEAYEVPDFSAGKAKAWGQIEQKMGPEEPPKEAVVIGMPLWRKYLEYAAAAVAILLGGYWLTWNTGLFDEAPRYATVVTEQGGSQVVTLPDGSEVTLNEKTTLRYPVDFKERIVDLEGEAFFNVVKRDEASFVINAFGSRTTVLGTSFNIRAYPGEPNVAVTVRTGKVEVAAQGKEKENVVLKPGQSAVYDKSVEAVRQQEVPNAMAWKTKELVFDNQRLSDVAATIERYFGQPVILANEQLGKCRFMGSFPDPGLQELLDAIAFTMELEIIEQNGQIIIRGDAQNCQ